VVEGIGSGGGDPKNRWRTTPDGISYHLATLCDSSVVVTKGQEWKLRGDQRATRTRKGALPSNLSAPVAH
jgi:hypothetical protein